MDDLFQALVAIAIISIGLLGGKKKKKNKPTSRPKPGTVPGRAQSQARGEGFKISPEDIGRILGIELPKPAPTPEAKPVTRPAPKPSVEPAAESAWEAGFHRGDDRSTESAWDAGMHRGSVTAETLEAAGGKSHERFHDLYMEGRSPAPAAVVHLRPDLDEVRRAIVWMEVLDTPVGMR